MAELSKIRKNGVDYDLKDTVAREAASKAVKTINGNAPDENGNVYVSDGGTVTPEQIASAVEDYMAEHPVEGGGMNSTASALLISILRNGVYTTQQAANITALEAALSANGGGSDGEATTYAIINNLAYVTTNNPTTVAEKDSEYISVLTVAAGYALDTVTVEMGGVDITASAYLNGEIYIPSVTGAVVITATAVATGTEEPPASGWVYDASKWLVGYAINAATGEVEANLKSAIYDEYIKNATSVTLTTKEYPLHLRIRKYDENKAYLGAMNSVTANSSNNYQVAADIKSVEYIKITVVDGSDIKDINAAVANLEVEF